MAGIQISLLLVLLLSASRTIAEICTKCSLSTGESGVCKLEADCKSCEVKLYFSEGWPISIYFCCPSVPKFPRDCGEVPSGIVSKIFDGKIIEPDLFSWFASLEYTRNNTDNNKTCSGTVINSRYVLTAAHCVTYIAIEALGLVTAVRLGGLKSGDYNKFDIERSIPFPYFTQDGYDDIALLRLSKPIKFGPKLKPICMPYQRRNSKNEPLYPANLTMSVWAHTLQQHETAVKRHKCVRIVSRKNCKIQVEETQLCSDYVQEGEVCNGDSGAPLMSIYGNRMVLEGILSTGPNNCTDTNSPLIFTRVRSYLDWLLKNMDMEDAK